MTFRKTLLSGATAMTLFSAGAAEATILSLTFTSGSTTLDSFKSDNASGVDNIVSGYLYFNIFDSLNGNNGMYVGSAAVSGAVGVGLQNGSLPNVNPTIFSANFTTPFWSGTGYDVTFTPGQTYTGTNGIQMSVGAVPEPAASAMLIAGFGLTGAAMRRRAAHGGA
jgi:hypothetical protein